jgi:hypothetical protein
MGPVMVNATVFFRARLEYILSASLSPRVQVKIIFGEVQGMKGDYSDDGR